MNRYWVFIVLVATAAWALPGTNAKTKADEAIVLRIASLAPSGSSWMKILNAWDKTLREKTNNRLQMRFYPGGAQGDERDFVRKMRVGQLDGGVVTVTGLSMLVKPSVVLVLPNLLNTYEKLDRVNTRMAPQFEKMFADEGYKILGWADAGKTRLFSQKPIQRPSDIKSMRPWVWKDDLIFVEFYDAIGASAIRLGVPEVYPALQTRMVDVAACSALAAVALQWYTRVKYMTAHNSAIIAGGTVMNKDRFDSLPPDLQAALASTGKRAHDLLNRTIRRDDDKAYDIVLKRGIKPVEAGEYQAEWDKAAKEVHERLTGRAYSQSLLEAVRRAAAP
ncbi:MAG: TRAP transporter substrate-binding protein DctP [Myxococcales bacterium]|nr:TRAP transporter substrate-binding protein DctP [Myxococcales bacterium]MDH3484899.1 TRAP transporter substrate-binding protein DctP [Myxococcales bacterium]